MVSRLRSVIMILVAFVAGTIACQAPVQSVVAVQQTGGGREADLRERLLTVLRVRTDAEREFVEAVVTKVIAGDIPQDLVDSSLFWVRDNKSDTPYPFFYFERVLRLRGQRAGVSIPVYRGTVPSGR